jgi:bifunctional UDP-N-acetylglucosamine pyrophosphorylase/glucosamine-1-phosphate N-acetyltransferase
MEMKMDIAAVILAAGQGTRMYSELPKVLHPILGKPMLWYALKAARKASGSRPFVVVGHGAEMIQEAFGDQAEYVLQKEQLGTGHAVWQTESILRDQADLVLVTSGDMPLLSAETLLRLVKAQRSHRGPFTMLTATSQDAHGFGRILRGPDGSVQAIVEEAQATKEQKAIQELNAGAYCFDGKWLWSALPKIKLSPKGEYYLTDLVSIAVIENLPVQAIQLADFRETIGINNRVHLAEATAQMQARINQQWMLAGVTMINPQATYIEPEVTIGQDTILWPDTYLIGTTSIGQGSEIGPNAMIRDSVIGNRTRILAAVMEQAELEDNVEIGPFARLRKGAHLAQGVHMGNFGEVKNSYLGPGTKMGHFSYIGDATIGQDVNIGAGTITCNFDGLRKYPTQIGAGSFIGSDTMLVAPVTLGEGAHTGAGAVVTKNVPDHSLAVGMPARVIRKLEKRDEH